MFDVFSERKTRDVLQDTWGHLAPEVGRKYSGDILFTCASDGEIVAINYDFKGLDGGPWLYEDVNEFIGEKASDRGTVYRFTGTYRKCKNGRAIFSGKVKKVKL